MVNPFKLKVESHQLYILCNPGHDSSFKEYLDKGDNHSLRDRTLKNANIEFIESRLYQTPDSNHSYITLSNI